MPSDAADPAREIFLEIVERPAQERDALVVERCGDDEALRAEVLWLLAHDRSAGRFLDTPLAAAFLPTAELPDRDAGAEQQKRIGRYEIQGVIGSGGMGTVYKAVQDKPHRIVALKVLRHGVSSRQAVRRLSHEAEVLGRLRHPNIAQVHDAGVFDEGGGVEPYFAMEYISGRPLLNYAEAKKLEVSDRLRLFEKICRAVQFAHHQGVIHRDLKPDNILVDGFGEPKILDFGVARATDSDIQATTLQTGIGQLIGTVPYMSPEQVAGDSNQLDTRSDVYSLGVVLYELLADRLPHDVRDKTIPEAVRVIGEEEPVPLSSVSHAFRGDLNTIVAKTLEKDKDRRYQTALELADDVRHFLHDEPIGAHPASTFYQLRKFARRNKAIVSGVAAVFVVLVAGVIGIGLALGRAKREAERAELINAFLEATLVSPDPYRGKKADLTVAELLQDASAEIEAQFASYPEVAIRVRAMIGDTYRGLGRLAEAETELRRAYEEGRETLGEDHPETLDALHSLVDVLYKLNRPDEGLPLARKLLDGQRRVHGESARPTLAAMSALAGALKLTSAGGRLEGESILREAVALSSQAYGDDDTLTYSLKRLLTNSLMRNYKLSDAEALARWLLDWCRERSEPEILVTHPMTELAFIVGWLGDPAEGAALARDAADQRIRLLGLDHASTRTSLYTAGLNLQWMGQDEEAERYFERHLSSKETPFAQFLHARLRMLAGELGAEEALPILEDFAPSLADPIRPFSSEMSLTAQGLCLVYLGRYEEAAQVMQRHPGELMEAIAQHHYERRLYLNTLTALYEGLGQAEKATEYRALLGEAESADEASE
jgi:tRNA A-37 threonylcarbamoyl transferase component Bud32/tetratricopeptide (TPR) repeat protein